VNGLGASGSPGADGQERDSVATEPDLSRRANHALDVLQRQVGQMVRLVDDLLDAGRISRGKIELRKERVELASIVHQAVEVVRPLAETKCQELTVALPRAALHLNADPARLAQIVGNLLNNACKFTDRGGHIWLTVELDRGPRNDETDAARTPLFPHVVIRVRDTGIGIAEDQLPRVFEMFTQVDTSLERPSTGLGIGLTLVKTLAVMHGGTVEARSDGIGEGSEFVVRLPMLSETATPPSEPPSEPEIETLRMLIVDDNRDAAESLGMLLNLSGHEIHTAHDGLTAVDAAIQLDPDVILLDLGLPGLNGYEVARKIRQRHGRGGRPVLVAVTGWGQDEDRRRSEQAGFDAHMVKPVDAVALRRLLFELGTGKQIERN
jgi:two-component system, chemotaxis family, CheB/CheR fusion protein